jgi:positive regulator of sigma E activity
MSHDSMCDERFDAPGYVARARNPQAAAQPEEGTVVAIESGIAQVELPRNSACGSCGMCACGSTTDTMLLSVRARPETRVGDRVAVVVNRRMRTRAQIWLFAFPLCVFLGVALGARKGLGLSDDVSFLLALLGLGGAFAVVWLCDRRYGWSAGPVAEIVASRDVRRET